MGAYLDNQIIRNFKADTLKALKRYKTYQNDELLLLLKEDDERAFTEIYNRYWKMLYAIAYTRVKDSQLTEDILHEVFASLWRNRGKSEINSLENYLSVATKYMVFAHIRKNAHFNRYLQSLDRRKEIDVRTETSLHNKQLLEMVAKEVERLPEKCRLVFKYSRECGMSTREIAHKMNISTKTVENQINRALHELRFSMRKLLSIFSVLP